VPRSVEEGAVGTPIEKPSAWGPPWKTTAAVVGGGTTDVAAGEVAMVYTGLVVEAKAHVGIGEGEGGIRRRWMGTPVVLE